MTSALGRSCLLLTLGTCCAQGLITPDRQLDKLATELRCITQALANTDACGDRTLRVLGNVDLGFIELELDLLEQVEHRIGVDALDALGHWFLPPWGYDVTIRPR